MRGRRKSGSEEGQGKRVRMAPNIAVKSNVIMGGVDNADHLRNTRTVRRGTQKPYIPLFFRTVDAIMTRSWLIYRRVKPMESMKKGSRKQIHLEVIRELAGLPKTMIDDASARQLEGGHLHLIQRVSPQKRGSCLICTSHGK